MTKFQQKTTRHKSLRELPLFASIEESDWIRLFSGMEFVRAGLGDPLLSLDEGTSDLFWLHEGRVLLYRETPFGMQAVAKLSAGTLFGELALIDGRGRFSNAEALSDVMLWRMDGEVLLELFQAKPKLACHFYRYFWGSLAHKIHLANGQLQKFFGGTFDSTAPEPTGRPNRPAWFAPPDQEDTENAGVSLDELPYTIVEDEKKREALQQAGLAPPEIALLFQIGEELFFRPGQKVFCEGDFGDTLFFILDGRVRISKKIRGVGEEALAILGPGQFFGEMALVAKSATRSADCSAHEGHLVLLAFRLHTLQALEGNAEHDLPFLQALCKMMSHRLREINEKLISWKMMSGGF